MRATTTAVIFTLLLSSCAPSHPEGGNTGDIMGATIIAVILGVGVAALAHSD